MGDCQISMLRISSSFNTAGNKLTCKINLVGEIIDYIWWCDVLPTYVRMRFS